jgi:lipopolysaccharide export LptBFGC system permease protein LptF
MICFLYWGFVQLGRALGHHGTLNPFLSAWLANLVFGSIGGVLLWKTPK